MAYQNVGTPRFYIDFPSYQNSAGLGLKQSTLSDDFFTLNPITPTDFYGIFSAQHQFIDFSGENSLKGYQAYNCDKMFLAILNHNLGDNCGLCLRDDEFGGTAYSEVDYLLNNMRIELATQGSSICTYKANPNSSVGITLTLNENVEGTYNQMSIGSICFGSYYDMSNSADLDLTMEIEFDGYNSFQTAGGSTLTNVTYNGSPWWYDKDNNKVEPFSVGASTGVSKRNGRRNWSMKFSYVTDKDLFASNYMSNTHLETTTDYDGDDLTTDTNEFEYTLNNDDSFIAQVLNKVGNGQRFIFQPDNTNNNPDQFAICVLDQDSLSIKQVAYKIYDISLKIREVW